MKLKLQGLIFLEQSCRSISLFGQVRSLHPSQWLCRQGDGKEVVETITSGSKWIGSAVLIGITPFIKEFYLHLLGRYIARQHPKITQGAIGIIVAPIGITVFQEDIAILIHIMISTATTGSGIEVENHFIVGLLQHGIKQSAQILFGCFSRYL